MLCPRARRLDLFFALRGGGNQFAVVTKMTLKVYDVGDDGQVWGGIRTYSAGKLSAILAAVSDFTANNNDSKAAIIPTVNLFGTLGIDLPEIVVFFFYDGASPGSGVFTAFDALTASSDDTNARTYADLAQETSAGRASGLRFAFRSATFPNTKLAKMSPFLDDVFDFIKNSSQAGALSDFLDFKIFTFTVQPLPHLVAEASSRAGGNALGLTPDSGDRIWMAYDMSWLNTLCDDKCPSFLKAAADAVNDIHTQKYYGDYPTNYKGGDLKYISYNPVFMNDAMYDQPILQSYGNHTYNQLKLTHAKYDPKGLFSTRQKGFTFST